jgi:broad specificity phosphatase PhoE
MIVPPSAIREYAGTTVIRGATALASEVYLIRHGETLWSLSGQHTGRTDLPLTDHGEQQALAVGRLLRGTTFSQALVSPLQRARRTCELAGFWPTARVQQNLAEWDYGDYEGRTAAQIHEQRPNWDVFWDGCPGGESPEQVTARAYQVVEELRRLDGRVVVFSHGHFLRSLAASWIGMPIQLGRHFGLDTGSLSILGYEHNNVLIPAILVWNAVSNDVFALEPR